MKLQCYGVPHQPTQEQINELEEKEINSSKEHSPKMMEDI
jgi:hypothetical protein